MVDINVNRTWGFNLGCRRCSIVLGELPRLLLMALSGLACAWTGPVAASAGGPWAATANQVQTALPGTGTGAIPASQRLHIVLGLKLPHPKAVAERVARMHQPGDALYGSRMTPSQFAAAGYLPTSAQIRAVTAYLSSQGFDQIHVDSNRLLISADGPAASVESAFSTRLQGFLKKNGKRVFANVTPVQVPTGLQNTVLSVLGLQDIVQARTGAVVAASGATAQQALPPPEFATAYGASGVPTASNTTVAIFMSGDLTQVLSDFRLANSQNHLPQVPVSIVQVGNASSDTSNIIEWDLDSQSSLGIAGNFKRMIWYQATSLKNADLAQVLNRWVTDDAALTANASFGECETDAKSSGFLAMTDQILLQAAAQGQTLFTASGDSGGLCPLVTIAGVSVGQPAVNYPASSPYAVGVGGTTLSTDSAYDYGSEDVWIDSGGGISVEETSPSWQQPVLPPPSSLLASNGKGVPDMAMDGNPNTGAMLIVNGQPRVVGGTSLSAPLAMGAWARIETAHDNQLGFAAPILYAQASGPDQPASGFHDINQLLSGNVLYQSGPGYDYASGLGSFDIGALLPLVSSVPFQTSTGSGTPATNTSGNKSGGSGGGAADPSGFMLLGLMALIRRRRKRSGS